MHTHTFNSATRVLSYKIPLPYPITWLPGAGFDDLSPGQGRSRHAKCCFKRSGTVCVGNNLSVIRTKVRFPVSSCGLQITRGSDMVRFGGMRWQKRESVSLPGRACPSEVPSLSPSRVRRRRGVDLSLRVERRRPPSTGQQRPTTQYRQATSNGLWRRPKQDKTVPNTNGISNERVGRAMFGRWLHFSGHCEALTVICTRESRLAREHVST